MMQAGDYRLVHCPKCKEFAYFRVDQVSDTTGMMLVRISCCGDMALEIEKVAGTTPHDFLADWLDAMNAVPDMKRQIQPYLRMLLDRIREQQEQLLEKEEAYAQQKKLNDTLDKTMNSMIHTEQVLMHKYTEAKDRLEKMALGQSVLED